MNKLLSKNLRLIFSDGIGRLYSVCEKGEEFKKPIVFINGQMEHRLQAIETATNITKSSCYQYSWYYEYEKSIHTPYIWVYDYPISKVDKGIYNTRTFAESLLLSLGSIDLYDVDIMGESVGGILGMRASLSDRVDRVLAIHPPILSSPFSDIKLLENLLKNKASTINRRQQLFLRFLKLIVDSDFGFQVENASGYKGLERNCALNKILIVGSSIYKVEGVKGLAKDLSELIYFLNQMPNDGIVCFDKDAICNRGFQVMEDEVPTCHLDLNLSYTKKLYKKIFLS